MSQQIGLRDDDGGVFELYLVNPVNPVNRIVLYMEELDYEG
jgi:hypothetical protein